MRDVGGTSQRRSSARVASKSKVREYRTRAYMKDRGEGRREEMAFRKNIQAGGEKTSRFPKVRLQFFRINFKGFPKAETDHASARGREKRKTNARVSPPVGR